MCLLDYIRMALLPMAFLTVIQTSALGAERVLTLNDFMQITNLVESHISPDGKQVAYVTAEPDHNNNMFRFSLHRSETCNPVPERLTTGPADFCPRWAPDSSRIAFLSDRGSGDQICVIPARGGASEIWTTVLTPIENFNWSPDGSMIAFLAAEGCLEPAAEPVDVVKASDDKVGHQLFVLDVKSRAIRPLTRGPGHIKSFCWAPDGSRIVYSWQATGELDDGFRQDLYVVTLVGGSVRPLVVRDGNDLMPEWSPDGHYIAFQSTCGPSKCYAKNYLCIVTPDGKPVSFAQSSSGVFEVDDVERMDWDARSDALLFSKIAGVESHLYRLRLRDGKIKRVSTHQGVYSGFSFSEDRRFMAFAVDSAKMPREVYVSSVTQFEPTRIASLNPALERRNLGEVERVDWYGPDGVALQGVLIKPVGYEEAKKYPLVTYLHGGPANAFRLAFGPKCLSSQQAEFFPTHVLAGMGYAIFCPNPRGSRGYGHEFSRQSRA